MWDVQGLGYGVCRGWVYGVLSLGFQRLGSQTPMQAVLCM